jgi:glycosyltransferase involved in cell wall biosynthesis
MNAAATSVIVPAFNESASIGPLITELRAAADWREILVIDDGSRDDTAERARTAGARVIHHPSNKGNGAAVKTGIRNASGLFVLIIDADGQHRPADELRLVAHLVE